MFYDNLTTHRVAAGLKIAVLARSSGVSESQIRRIEKHSSSTEETLNALVNTLNEATVYKNRPINPAVEISEKSRFGDVKSQPTAMAA